MRRTHRLGLTFGAAALAVTCLSAGSASASAAPAAAGPTHSLRFMAVQLVMLQAGASQVTASRDVQHGTVTGTNVVTCGVDLSTHRAACDAAIARPDGLIYAHVVISLDTGHGRGRVSGGTGHFKGASGTISVTPGSVPETTWVALSYRT
jgi:hypothetical protein